MLSPPDVLRTAFAGASSVLLHVSVLLVAWWHPWPEVRPPEPPPDGAPVSLATFDYDDAPPLSSSPTPVATPTPPDEAPPAPVHVTATIEPIADPDGVAAIEPTPSPAATETGDGEKAAAESKKGDSTSHGAKAKNPRKVPKPCPEPVADIEQLGPAEWFVQRALIEYYADHIPEIDKLGSVWVHRGADGKPDGFRIGLPRCTVLRQGGIKSGDIVHDINGIKINNVLQAVSAYIRLRKEPLLHLRVTRKKESMMLNYHLEQPPKRAPKPKKTKK
ncbi:MAG: hypothetical protein EXR69_13805 [Myxococcales bacterium]|nr:hypothetical protein [Myxococcales bacterium]